MSSGEHVLTTGRKKFYQHTVPLKNTIITYSFAYHRLNQIKYVHYCTLGIIVYSFKNDNVYWINLFLYALKATLKFSFNPKSEERVEASGVYNFC